MLTITLLGTGGPIPDPHRAGPATLVTGGSEQYLVDAGRACRVGTLVLTHYFPPPADGDEDTYRSLAAEHFDGAIEVGDDLHRVEIRS